MGCTYVKDFDFKKSAGDMSAKKSGYAKGGYCEGGTAKKTGYAKGGGVVENKTGEVYPSRKVMMKHEKMESPKERREELVQKIDTKRRIEIPENAMGRKTKGVNDDMVRPSPRTLPVVDQTMAPARLAVEPRRSVPVAPRGPLIPLKAGGSVPKAGAYKMPKVMNEFKAGKLHSGSKEGPVVKNPKQAVAIAMSEARKAAKR